jgi:hypothetical protein
VVLRFADLPAPTPAEVDWAEKHLDMPTVVSFSDNYPVRHFLHDGSWYRDAGFIWASETKGRFRIWLNKGATDVDLEYFEYIIERAKQGMLARHGWREKSPGTWSFTHHRLAAGPETVGGRGTPLVECDEPACSADWHSDWDVKHVADSIENDAYSLEVFRYGPNSEEEGDHEWRVYLVAQDAELTPAASAGLVSDLQWLTVECRRLNDAGAAVL